jgi:hypothetical protein
VKKDPREKYVGTYDVEIYDYYSIRRYDTVIKDYKWVVITDTIYRDILNISYIKKDTIRSGYAQGLAIQASHSREGESWGLADSTGRLFHVIYPREAMVPEPADLLVPTVLILSIMIMMLCFWPGI